MPEASNDPPTGVIFDIQRYSIHDGAGIRTLVFLKGCPLRCLWCCNPESQSSGPELSLNAARCIRCGLCVETCPVKAIDAQPDGDLTTDRSTCRICGACCEACPMGGRVVRGQLVTVPDLLREVERDRMFFRVSGGGVTVSGGEPLLQARFVADFLSACRHSGIDTAIETCGFARWEEFALVLAHTDTLLFDIKHVDSDAHSRLTGVGNDLILANLRHAVDSKARIVLRMPLIPGYNADPTAVKSVADLARMLGIFELHLLPYHGFGEAKYAALGRAYPLTTVRQLSAEQVGELKAAAEAGAGLLVRIGG
jgi:glycyl-radical enzyme activating protein